MKTTLEISDALLMKAKACARKEHTTLRALTEEGLAQVLNERAATRSTRIQPVTFKGKGLSEEFQGVDWPAIRDTAYGLDRR